jgi:hypothetical protein
MKKIPHLPPKSCNINAHYKLQFLPWLLFFVMISIIAGVAATLSTVAWIAPSVVVEQPMYQIFGDRRNSNINVDQMVLRQTKQRILNIYNKNKKIGNKFYSEDARLFDVVGLSADGWVVGYYPDYIRGMEKNWDIIDYQGEIFSIEKSFIDPISALLYLKIKKDDLRVMSFANFDINDNHIWSLYGNNTVFSSFDSFIKNKNNISSYIWNPLYTSKLDNDLDIGSILLNAKGELVGFSDKDNNVIFGWYVEKQINSILENNQVKYTALSVQGFFVDQLINESMIEPVKGFYITTSFTRPTEKTIGVGDLILSVNNKPINRFDLAKDILLSSDELSLMILRNDKELEIKVKKVKI